MAAEGSADSTKDIALRAQRVAKELDSATTESAGVEAAKHFLAEANEIQTRNQGNPDAVKQFVAFVSELERKTPGKGDKAGYNLILAKLGDGGTIEEVGFKRENPKDDKAITAKLGSGGKVDDKATVALSSMEAADPKNATWTNAPFNAFQRLRDGKTIQSIESLAQLTEKFKVPQVIEEPTLPPETEPPAQKDRGKGDALV